MVYDLEKLEIPPLPSLEETEKQAPVITQGHISRFQLQWVVSALLLLMVFLIHLWWPQGNAVMKSVLVAETIGPMEQAGQEMVKEILSGVPLPEAIAVFTREALDALS